MRQSFNPSGIAIAVLGVLLTRSTVTSTLTDTPTTFLIGGVLPLVLGLSLSAFGVVLTIGAFETTFVRTVARWTLLGVAFIGMLVLVTVFGVGHGLLQDGEATSLFSNVLIGGSVGGALLGIYAARNRTYQRELLHRQNRLVLLNRLLLDEVLNAVTVIKGSVPLLKEEARPNMDLVEAIHGKAERIEEVIDDVRSLAEPSRERPLTSVNVDDAIDEVLDRARDQHPEVAFSADRVPDDVAVRATPRLVDALFQLVAAGAERADGSETPVQLVGSVDAEVVTLAVIGDGQMLSADEREALEHGTTIAEGDPTTHLGFYIARLLVRAVGGTLDVNDRDGDTKIAIVLDREPEADAVSSPIRAGSGS